MKIISRFGYLRQEQIKPLPSGGEKKEKKDVDEVDGGRESSVDS